MRQHGPLGCGTNTQVLAELVFSASLVVIGVYVFWHGSSFGRQLGYSAVGPAAFPMGIGLCLASLGAAMGWHSWRRGGAEPVVIAWSSLLLTLGAFAGYLLLLWAVGFMIATPLFLVAAARVLGSRTPLLDLAVGVLLTAAVMLSFRYGLGVQMPEGELLDALRG